ncbi:AAA family ATPase [Aromatoleum evansii]|uniref:AAA family ATPase n=1 Tax=Aromatoleum evansii TaxID=59406 RepID=UPI00145F5E0C|nr:MoxR family ATPase [Aromatoleum evansii]NMG31977.1 AAA domain-containing protein [Aromatoleum evansii]
MTSTDSFRSLARTLETLVLGQSALVERLLVTLLADGHLLVEGPPGVAKTRAAHTLAALIDADFHRIQFTPDLLPADLTGSEIFRPQDGSFHFERGPLFHNLLLADEINRAPAKVQSALLEAMGERQVTIGQETHVLPRLFLVMATQNPIEHEGTYPLPEAQLDRFLMHVRVGYPDTAIERDILRLARAEALAGADSPASPVPTPAVTPDDVFAARAAVLDLYLSPELEDYILQLVAATRAPERYVPELSGSVRYGASPRASIAFDRCARARAWLHGRDYVSPDDIRILAPDILRHRIIPGWEAQADGITADSLIATLLDHVPVP